VKSTGRILRAESEGQDDSVLSRAFVSVREPRDAPKSTHDTSRYRTLSDPGLPSPWVLEGIGAPFFLALPMSWFRLRALFSVELSTTSERRVIWTVTILSICGTFAVEVPFLLHRAGTSEAQRLAVLALGYGTPIVTGALGLKYRAKISPTQACLLALNTAYLANAGLCLPVYGQVPGTLDTKPGWLVMLVIVWPMLLEIVCIFVRTRDCQE